MPMLKSLETSSSYPEADAVVGSSVTDTGDLARLIGAHTPYDGRFELRIPGVYAIRRSRTDTNPVHYVQRPAVCIVAQGAKSLLLGNEVYEYDEEHMIVFSVELPLAGQITRASRSEPFLC